MKRLFKLMVGTHTVRMCDLPHDKTGLTTPAYFENKQDAKIVRNVLGDTCRVSRGPDHIGKHSGYGVPRMRRQPKQ